jgi:hypothetical protein
VINNLRAVLVFAAVVGALTAPVSAQQDPPPRSAALRRELEQRFVAQMRDQLQLSSDQETRVRGIMSGYAERRGALEDEQRDMRQALNSQLRPGIAANGDSVAKLVDGIAAGRVSYARLVQDELRELTTVLTPVQRGQLFLLRDRVLQRVQEMRQNARQRGTPPP